MARKKKQLDIGELEDLLYEYEHSNMDMNELITRALVVVFDKLNQLEEEVVNIDREQRRIRKGL